MKNQKVETRISCVKEKRLLIAYELLKSNMTITSDSVRGLWIKWYPEDEKYFDELHKWNNCYNWISKHLEDRTSDDLVKYINRQRNKQKRELNQKCKYLDKGSHVIFVKNKIKKGQLAKYLLINGAERRCGNYGSLVSYLNYQKEKSKTDGKN